MVTTTLQNRNTSKVRYQEIDILRGIAVLSMIAFHTTFIIQAIFKKHISSSLLFWQGIPILIGGTFLILAGLSLYIARQRGKYSNPLVILQRSGFLFLLGILLTLSTYLLNIGGVVYFGILHCIGLSTFISFYLLSLPKYILLVISLLLISIGMYWNFNQSPCLHISLFWLYHCHCASLRPMLDYYPLIPWLGFILLGIVLGKQYYPKGECVFYLRIFPKVAFYMRPISFLGKHSLFIYCIHTPIIFIILYLILA
jgi:uncharacterized membrane protein